jgi:hypothetical protein
LPLPEPVEGTILGIQPLESGECQFKPDDAQHCASRAVHLPVATNDTGKLISAALAGLGSIWRSGYRYKKAGVILLDLYLALAVQDGLFDKKDAQYLSQAGPVPI